MSRTIPRDELSLPIAVTHLMRGVVYREASSAAWQHIQGLATAVSDYVATLGLTVVIDESEGYAFLRSQSDDELDDLGVPRLVPRHQLPLLPSLLLALLRRRMAEFDSTDSGTRLIVSGDEIRESMAPFFAASTNEARTSDQVESSIRRVIDLGFLRRVPNEDDQFEVRRVLKSFVDAQWLAGLDKQIAEYADLVTGTATEGNR